MATVKNLTSAAVRIGSMPIVIAPSHTAYVADALAKSLVGVPGLAVELNSAVNAAVRLAEATPAPEPTDTSTEAEATTEPVIERKEAQKGSDVVEQSADPHEAPEVETR